MKTDIYRKIITSDSVKAVILTEDNKYHDIFIISSDGKILQSAINQKDPHIASHELINWWEEELKND